MFLKKYCIISNGKYLIGELVSPTGLINVWLRMSPPLTLSLLSSFSLRAYQPVHNVGVCKAYDTKVGTHIFLTQLEEEHPQALFLKSWSSVLLQVVNAWSVGMML